MIDDDAKMRSQTFGMLNAMSEIGWLITVAQGKRDASTPRSGMTDASTPIRHDRRFNTDQAFFYIIVSRTFVPFLAECETLIESSFISYSRSEL
jgi:hypothetical protein